MTNHRQAGFTLVELIVAVGLFAFVMMLVSSAYFIVIGVDNESQGIATGVDSLSFALEAMSRNIRTGTTYNCGLSGGDCPFGDTSFSFNNSDGQTVVYGYSANSSVCGTSGSTLGNGCITQTIGTATTVLTDPAVDITSLKFIVLGTAKTPTDYTQPHVTILVAGTISSGSGGKTESFSLETGATMRGTDI